MQADGTIGATAKAPAKSSAREGNARDRPMKIEIAGDDHVLKDAGSRKFDLSATTWSVHIAFGRVNRRRATISLFLREVEKYLNRDDAKTGAHGLLDRALSACVAVGGFCTRARPVPSAAIHRQVWRDEAAPVENKRADDQPPYPSTY